MKQTISSLSATSVIASEAKQSSMKHTTPFPITTSVIASEAKQSSMKHTIAFLSDLYENNYKEWFDAHKSEYLEAKKEFDAYVNELIKGIYDFDPSIGMQDAKSCCYRIYRDIRFSSDKTPYKSWMGAFVCKYGRKSGGPGYYFHVQPKGDYLSGHLLAVGLYNPDKTTVKKIRDGILYEGDIYDRAIKEAAKAGFTLDEDAKLKVSPPGYPKDAKYKEYLKYKNFCLSKQISEEDMAPEKVIADFKATHDFMNVLTQFMNV